MESYEDVLGHPTVQHPVTFELTVPMIEDMGSYVIHATTRHYAPPPLRPLPPLPPPPH